VVGDNPGVYEKVAQTEWWPFIPAVGVVVGACLAVVFILTTVMAVKRESPVSWAAASGLITILVLGFSTFGCVVALSQYEERDRQHHDLYVTQVADWVSGKIGGQVTISDTARLLNGESLTAVVGGRPSILYIKQDRPNHLLQLLVNEAA
jgi:hypothetical protein